MANGGAGGVLGATNTVTFNAIDGKNLTEKVGTGAALGALGGAVGSLGGDAIDGTRQAMADAKFDELPTAIKNLADGIGVATNSAGANSTSANAASLGEVIGNTVSNSVGTIKSATDCAIFEGQDCK